MPATGQTITNPATGDAYQFIETAADTRGARVRMKACIKSRGQLVPKHFHVLQDETFEVLEGRLTVILEGRTQVLGPGETITLPRNVPHNHFNDHHSPVTYQHTVTPALDFDLLIENLVGLAADGRSRNGKYGLVQELVALRYLDSRSYLADVPVAVQDTLARIVGPIARLFGYRAVYRKYSGMEK